MYLVLLLPRLLILRVSLFHSERRCLFTVGMGLVYQGTYYWGEANRQPPQTRCTHIIAFFCSHIL